MNDAGGGWGELHIVLGVLAVALLGSGGLRGGVIPEIGLEFLPTATLGAVLGCYISKDCYRCPMYAAFLSLSPILGLEPL